MKIADSVRARRYLLQEASDEECAAVEREYLEHADALDRIASAEDDLIEEYLTHGLSPGDRLQFERVYLAVPHRRARVATIRRLMGRDEGPAEGASGNDPDAHRPIGRGQWLALAASLIFGACGGLWVNSPFGIRRAATVRPETAVAAVESTASANGHVAARFVVALASVTSRSRAATETFVLPAGTGVVTMLLEGAGSGMSTASSASIRIAGAGNVWRGPVTLGEDLPPGIVARVDVPAEKLPFDDYVVTLYGTDQAGAERELMHYALRLRSE